MEFRLEENAIVETQVSVGLCTWRFLFSINRPVPTESHVEKHFIWTLIIDLPCFEARQ